MRCAIALIVVLGISMGVFAQTTRPATRPSEPPNPDMMLRQLLSPARRSAKPLEPVIFPPEVDQSSKMAVAPKTDPQNLVREGSYIPERVGRLTRTADGQNEFTFESDGSALKDPPMIILPNLKLMGMETMVFFSINGTEISARVNPADAQQPGERMRFTADLRHMHLIDPSTNLVIEVPPESRGDAQSNAAAALRRSAG